jgi:hypothetical protein
VKYEQPKWASDEASLEISLSRTPLLEELDAALDFLAVEVSLAAALRLREGALVGGGAGSDSESLGYSSNMTILEVGGRVKGKVSGRSARLSRRVTLIVTLCDNCFTVYSKWYSKLGTQPGRRYAIRCNRIPALLPLPAGAEGRRGRGPKRRPVILLMQANLLHGVGVGISGVI